MSDLQVVLIVIGALIIVGVIVFNWWQERKFHQQVERSFSPLKNDALLDDPMLDVSNLNIAMDEIAIDHASFEDRLPNQEVIETFEKIDAVSTDKENPTAPTLPDSLVSDASQHDNQNLPTNEHTNNDVSVDIKSELQHNDIKSIFNEAFRQSIKTTPPATQSDNVQIDTKTENPVRLTNDIVTEAEHDAQDPALSLPSMLHSQIDLTAVLYLAKETSISELSSAFSGVSNGYDKPVFVHVLDTNKQWVLLKEVISNPAYLNQKSSKITCSLQLADRAGAVSRNTLNRFQLAIETLGLDINAHVEWQGTGDALTAATTLDAFCIEVDKTIGLHLTHGENGAFTGTKLKGLAEAQGMTLSNDGTFKYFDKDPSTGKPVTLPSFVMFNRDDYPFNTEMLRTSVVKGITFQLDIPHVKHCAEAYSQMVQVARQMEIGLHSTLVADNNKALGDIQIEKIRQQLKVIHASMLTRGIVPGSECALRLFS